MASTTDYSHVFILAAGANASAVARLSLGNTMVACQQPVPLHDARFSDWHFSEGKGRVQLPFASLGRYRLPYKVLPAPALPWSQPPLARFTSPATALTTSCCWPNK